jgi:16S rRNA processing protein RimM
VQRLFLSLLFMSFDITPFKTTDWPADAVQVGRVAGAYGLKGMLKIAPESSDSAALLKSATWWLELGVVSPKRLALATRGRKPHAGGVVAAAEGVADRTQAEAFKGASVFVSRADFPAAKDDEFYWVDLIGLTVINQQGVVLGTVAGLIENSAQSILRVSPTEANTEVKTEVTSVVKQSKKAEILIPFVKQFVGEVSLSAKTVQVDWQADWAEG